MLKLFIFNHKRIRKISNGKVSSDIFGVYTINVHLTCVTKCLSNFKSYIRDLKKQLSLNAI